MSGRSSRMPEVSAKEEARPVVLIAEDEEPIAQVLAYMVEDAGYTAINAIHGRAALELAYTRRPDLIITDLMMPQMNGKELIHALRERMQADTPPIVLMTAAGVRYAEDAGADAVLLKPFDLEQVEEILQRYLENS